METFGKFGDWIVNNIIKPMFGETYWAEITALIVCLVAAAFISVFIYICVRYKKTLKDLQMYKTLNSTNLDKSLKYKEEKETLSKTLDNVNSKLAQVESELEVSKNKEVELQKDVEKLQKAAEALEKKTATSTVEKEKKTVTTTNQKVESPDKAAEEKVKKPAATKTKKQEKVEKEPVKKEAKEPAVQKKTTTTATRKKTTTANKASTEEVKTEISEK